MKKWYLCTVLRKQYVEQLKYKNMAKYNITVKANRAASCNGTRFTKDIPFPTTVINGNMDDVANHINKMLTGIYNMNRISLQGVRFPKTTHAYKSNIEDIYAIGYGFVTVTNLYSGDYIETVRYEFSAERIV